MKGRMLIFSVLMSFSIMFGMFSVNVKAGKTITENEKGTIDGYDYEFWTDSGNASMTLNGDGTFSCQWNKINQMLSRMGRRFYPGKTHEQIGNISINYAANFLPGINSSMGVYGWMKDPNIEYHIVDSWGEWKPPGTRSKGIITVDGATYEVFEFTPVFGESFVAWPQYDEYWCVRTSKRTSGTISVSEHFKAWESIGMKLGKLTEVSFFVQGYQSTGSIDVTSMTINIDTPKPTNTPDKTTPPEDFNKDGAINMADVMLLAQSFNSVRGDSRYEVKFDLNNDGAINMADVMRISIAARNQYVQT